MLQTIIISHVFCTLSQISQFDNSDYDALWDGVMGDIMHKPNDLWHNFELPNWLIYRELSLSFSWHRNVREAVPYPVTVLLQGHFWWHIMSGFGVHLHLMYSMHLRTSYLKCAPQIKVRNVEFLRRGRCLNGPLFAGANSVFFLICVNYASDKLTNCVHVYDTID